MDIAIIKEFFLWCFVLNLVVLVFWSMMLLFTKKGMFALHRKFFDIDEKQMSMIHYGLLGGYKLIIYAFFLFPYIALCLIDR